MELTDALKQHALSTVAVLHGSERRLFMARIVQLLGPGGQRRAERELGWNRVTIRKGLHELTSGIRCVDAFCLRGVIVHTLGRAFFAAGACRATACRRQRQHGS
jgi:hypothetical protein